MIGIDLFAGAGGMSLGAVMAGVEVVLAVEQDPHAAETYSRNHPRTLVCCEDIRNMRKLPKVSRRVPVILFGGPPCQGFSTSNQRTRGAANASNWLFREFIRLAHDLKPDWIVFENVRGLAETNGGAFLGYVAEALCDLGYGISKWILNAVDFGVPQSRSRLFILASRDWHHIGKPAPVRARPITVHEAIADLPVLRNGATHAWLKYRRAAHSNYARAMRGGLEGSPNHYVTRNADSIVARYEHVPQGGNWERIPRRLMRNYADRRRCHTGIYHRLRGNRPSTVIGNFRKNMLIHPTQNRGLSVREAARIQSFPDWYEFHGSIGFQQQQVGDAVPPLLAMHVFEAVQGNCRGCE